MDKGRRFALLTGWPPGSSWFSLSGADPEFSRCYSRPMHIRPNRLKRKLRAGERATGCWIFLSGGDSTELLSHCGFDAFIVDHEQFGIGL